MEKTVDICVVGAAGSGLTAAIRAKQLGAKDVLILEKMPTIGGCTTMSAGTFGVNTPAQHRQGYEYSADKMYHDLMEILNWNCDAKLVRKWITRTGETFEWLEDLGVRYSVAVTETADGRVFRNTMHRIAQWDGKQWNMLPQGRILVDCFKKHCDEMGVEIYTKTRAKHLIKEDGKIVGVEAEKDGETLTVHAKAVILCTGSISTNKELIRRFYGTADYDDVRIMAQVPHNTGDGLIMAEEIGGTPGKISSMFIGPHNHFPGASEITGLLVRRPHGIKVNCNGERFTDESIPFYSEYGWMLSVSVDNQPGKTCYNIMDQSLMDIVAAGEEYIVPNKIRSILDYPMMDKGNSYQAGQFPSTEWRKHIQEHFAFEQENGRARVCQTLAEAAEFIGCDEATLTQTINHYNECCALGYDDEFLKNPNYLYPLQKAPYYVILGKSGIDTCLGGLKIDNHQHVVTKEGRAIPGLYAAGVLTSGWCAGLYAVNGSEMSYTMFSGRNAAEEACAYAGI